MSTNTQSLKAAQSAAAAEVLAARSALGTVCRYDGSADAIAAARLALKQAKVVRLRADADYLAAGLPPERDRYLVTADMDPEVRPTPDNHAALVLTQQRAAADFLASHPRPRDPDGEDAWDRATRKAYGALLDSFTAAHVALGCALSSPCRMPWVTVP